MNFQVVKSLSFKDSSCAHTSSNAHRDNSELFVSALEFIEKSNYLSCTCASERVSKSYSTSSGVELLRGYLKLFNAVCCLTSESFIDFKNINIIDWQTCFLESGRDSYCWTDSHNFGWATSNGKTDNAALNLKSEFLSNISASEKNCSSTISDLTGVSSSDWATDFLECWLKFS